MLEAMDALQESKADYHKALAAIKAAMKAGKLKSQEKEYVPPAEAKPAAPPTGLAHAENMLAALDSTLANKSLTVPGRKQLKIQRKKLLKLINRYYPPLTSRPGAKNRKTQ